MITFFMSVNGKSENSASILNSFSVLETESQGRDKTEQYNSHPIRLIREVLPVFFCWFQRLKEFIGTIPSEGNWNEFTLSRSVIGKVIDCLESINHSSPYKKKLNDIMQHLTFLTSNKNFPKY